jgi:nicotinate-nucleotide--dimethylbenzimidazole phosphoribosyltransferase
VSDLLERTIAAIGPLDADAMRAAEARQLQLTKPPKALGRLETLSIQPASRARRSRSSSRRPSP